MNKKRIGIPVFMFSLIVGCIFGFFIAKADFNGYFTTKWQAIEAPPVSVQKMVGLSRDSLWIKSSDGDFYYNKSSSICKHNCWVKTAQIPFLPIKEVPGEQITNEPCTPPLPIIGIKEKISQCRYEAWWIDNYIFALEPNNSIFLWQSSSYTEWSSMMSITDMFIGAISFFLITLLIKLILANRN